MKITPLLAAGVASLTLIAGFSMARLNAAEAGWDAVPAILARIKAPEFPARDFPITDFGAKADGTTDCTEAIAKAIAACHAAGGGRVVVDGGASGVFLTGAVHLLSNVNLYVAEGTTLKFSPDPAKFLPVVLARFEGTECMNYSPLIYALDQENIAVTGKGTLDGSASRETWWGLRRAAPAAVDISTPPASARTAATPAPVAASADTPANAAGARGARGGAMDSRRLLIDMGEKGVPVAERIFGDKGTLRPNFFVPYRCKNILIADVHIINSPMWEISPELSSNITVRGVDIHSHGPNNDGCDPESCRDVLIEGCTFDTGDDCIAIKSGKDADGRRVNLPSENLIIRNCIMMDGHGGVVLGSENSGGIRNVYAENCKMDSPNLQRALRLKTNAGRGGYLENVYMRNVTVGHVSDSILTIDLVYERKTSGAFVPTVRNVVMGNVTSTSSPRVLSVVGIKGSIIEGVRVENCTFRGVEGADILTYSGDVAYKNVTIEPAARGRTPAAAPGKETAKPAEGAAAAKTE